LRLVAARPAIALPPGGAPEAWRTGLAQLLGWIGLASDAVAASGMAPLFAPWHGHASGALHDAAPPGTHFAASYCLDHPRGAAVLHRGIDLTVISPHPAVQDFPEARATMIRAARAEGRERIAIIARNHAQAARLAGVDLLTLEQALPRLSRAPAQWDAIIVPIDQREPVMSSLRAASGVTRPWPLLWRGRDGVLRAVTTEVAAAAPSEGEAVLPLEAQGLVLALALALHHAGSFHAARRLHDGWARLRDSGVTTPGRGARLPYVTAVTDPAFITLLCADAAVSRRPVTDWRALSGAQNAKAGSQCAGLRIVVSNS
jgi:hypothetical protein